jgi:tetratricopeptide (TPR) repeat protein
MPAEPRDVRKSFIEKAKRHMEDGKWPELMLAMDAVILTRKGEDDSTKRELLMAHRMRAHALARMTRFTEAVADYQEALELSKVVGDKVEEAMCLEGLGNVSWNMGESELALDFLKSALALTKETGDTGTEGQVIISLASIDKAGGKLQAAVDGLLKAIELLSVKGHSEPLARAYYKLGDSLIKLGQIDEAFLFLEQAVESADKVGNISSRGFSKIYLAICYARSGETARAMELADNAIADLGKAHDKEGIVEAMGVHGMVQFLMGRSDLALQDLRQAESMAMRDGLDAAKSEVLVLKAEVLAGQGNLVNARIAYTEAIGLLKKLGNKGWAEMIEKELAGLEKGK